MSDSGLPVKITIVSHYSFGNAPWGYMIVRVEVAKLFSVEAERNPNTDDKFVWPAGFTPTEWLTNLLHGFDMVLRGEYGMRVNQESSAERDVNSKRTYPDQNEMKSFGHAFKPPLGGGLYCDTCGGLRLHSVHKRDEEVK